MLGGRLSLAPRVFPRIFTESSGRGLINDDDPFYVPDSDFKMPQRRRRLTSPLFNNAPSFSSFTNGFFILLIICPVIGICCAPMKCARSLRMSYIDAVNDLSERSIFILLAKCRDIKILCNLCLRSFTVVFSGLRFSSCLV